MQSDEVAVWNRACMEAGGGSPRAGDLALAAMIRCHGEVMSGGMFFAVRDSLTSGEISAGIAGFRYFGLDEPAEVLAGALSLSDDELDSCDERYWQAVPDDETLMGAFVARLAADPSAFAPVAAAEQ